MNIAINVNDAYIPCAMVMLQSLFENNPECSIVVHLLHASVSETELEKFRRYINSQNGELKVYTIDTAVFQKFPDVGRWSVETYFRLLLPEVMPVQIKKVLYLGADIIVNGSIKELYNMDFGKYCIIACPNMDCAVDAEERNKRWNRKGQLQYFNAGVMLLNLEKMRKRCSIEKYCSIIRKAPDDFPMLDQDLLNYVFGNDVSYVPALKYNYIIAPNSELEEGSTIIYHFGTKDKPWQKMGAEKYYEIWWQYARKLL